MPWIFLCKSCFSNILRLRTRSTLHYVIWIYEWHVLKKSALFWCCFSPHQVSARTAQVRTEENLWTGYASHRLPKIPHTVKGHTILLCPEELSMSYVGVFSYHDSYPLFGRVQMGRLVKVVLLGWPVCERNFYCLVRTKSGWVTENGKEKHLQVAKKM